MTLCTEPLARRTADWQSELPQYWACYQLRRAIISMCDGPFGSDMKSSHYADDGVRLIRLQNIGDGYFDDDDKAFISYEHFASLPGHDARAGDLLVAGLGDQNHPVGRGCVCPPSAGMAMVKADCFRLRLNQQALLHPFVAHFLSSNAARSEIALQMRGATRERMNLSGLAAIRVPVPPISEQRAIAAFLDRKTAAIDTVIAKKQRTIELLNEERQAFASHAVTKGLDPSVAMRDSGIEWIGAVPTHWAVERLKVRMYGLEQGWSPQCENRQTEPGEWGVLKVGCMNSGIYDENENKALPQTEKPLPEYEVQVGDVLMSRSNTVQLVGAVGMVHRTQGRILLCDKLYRLRFDDRRLLPQYAVHLLRAHVARQQIERDASGASPSMKNISNDRVRNLMLPFPPLSEQPAIVKWITEQANRIDQLVARISEHIERLMAYRTAIITAAVTGRLVVPSESRSP